MTGWMYVLGWILVHFVWQGSVIAVGAALVLRLCRTQRSSVRYAIACGALLSMLLAVMATSVRIEAPADVSQAVPRATVRTSTAGAVVLLPIQFSQSAPDT